MVRHVGAAAPKAAPRAVERARTRPTSSETRAESPAPKKADAFDGRRGTSSPVSTSSIAAKGPALLELAQRIESGESPLKNLQDRQRAALLMDLTTQLTPDQGPKRSRSNVTARSAAVTTLLSLAQSSRADLREKALTTYLNAMQKEPVRGLQQSMAVNLKASGLKLAPAQQAVLDGVHEKLLPSKPPYDVWFNGNKHSLNVRHYVMDEFFKGTVSQYKARGYEVVSQTESRVELRRVLDDTTGAHKPVNANITVMKGQENIFRDMDDPDVQMVIYSGHSQFGGVVTESLRHAPQGSADPKLVQLYQCRGKQTAGDIQARYPNAHLTTTFSSAYDSDDTEVLHNTLDVIARRGSYDDMRRRNAREDLLQPTSNYILPNDERSLAHRDTDRDGIADHDALGPDRFFDPQRAAVGESLSFKPMHAGPDPQQISGEKVSHAVGFANTAFFYFSEDNRAAPLTVKKSDRFISDGWFKSDKDDPVRITVEKRDGQTFHRIAVNSKYANQDRGAISAMVLMEMQKFLCKQDHGKFTEADALRGVILVGNYVDLMCEYAEECDAILKGTGEKYGISGLDYAKVFNATKKDGHDGFASPAALKSLRDDGVRVG